MVQSQNESNSEMTLKKLEQRISDVEQKMQKFNKQIMILMSELSSPFAIPKDDNE